jgi:F-type H+-transporting ATPase subunit b
MHALALLLQVHDAAPAETIAQTFGVDWLHLGAQVISFAIVCALLSRLAYKPVLATLAARREQIAQGLANTEKINAALAAIAAERQQVLATARDEANRIVDDARDVAKRLKDVEAQRATAEAAQILAHARDAAAREHTRMLGELRAEVGRLVVKTTAAVAGKVLTADDHQRLARETASQLSAS